MIKNRAKIEAALRLRDIAVGTIERIGKWGSISVAGKTIKIRELRAGSLHFALSTPFQRLPGTRELPYGLDIWSGAKVLNVVWNGAGWVELVTFRRGEWESEVVALSGGD
jgi:hypothetical protein